MTNSGWFRERSACYLATGRPVITQETGFSDWIETGCGLLSFRDPQQAIATIEEVSANYDRHCQHAREIAAEYFDHRKVLPALLDSALDAAQHDQRFALAGAELHADFHELVSRIAQLVPADKDFLLVDDAEWGLIDQLAGRRFLPFLERNGVYYGRPADDAVAIAELDRMVQAGARFIVFAAPPRWWLEYYCGFRDYLLSKHSLRLQDDKLVIFELRP